MMVATLMSLASCATKRKTKDVEKLEVKTENVVKNDSSVNLQLQKSSYDYLQNYSKSETLLQKLGLTYAGKTNEDKGKVSLKQTKDGLELDIQGAIAMALDQAQQKDENFTKAEMIKLMDSIYSVKLQQDLVQREQRLIDYFKSNKENDTIGFQFGAYLTGFGVVCFVIFLVWIGGRVIISKCK
ncbi:hypothetical protein [Empedobacter brevis]|uniref:hypothetical protein n=1 Tax=Empedobacter brevis TaxID=247 RepID=UPI0039B0216A